MSSIHCGLYTSTAVMANLIIYSFTYLSIMLVNAEGSGTGYISDLLGVSLSIF